MEDVAFSLYELNCLIKGAMNQLFQDEYWVTAELSEAREARNGHCYVEFIEKSSYNDNIIAKAQGTIWHNNWMLIKHHFESETKQSLSKGMKVLAKVSISYHEVYGFKFNVIDINPTFTLGDIAQRREEILKQLREEGIAECQKELPLPRLLQRIAVISSATAAGYGDFFDQLHNNKYGLAFYTELFEATMQGNDVERSIIAALDKIAQNLDHWDAVVIIRGGGATSDLTGFDTLLLAENVAQFPLPIITGIGHERDDTVLDMISHTRVKTPTAAAEFLILHQAEELFTLDDYAARITQGVTERITKEDNKIRTLTSKLPLLFSQIQKNEINRLSRISVRLAGGTNLYVESRKRKVDNLDTRLDILIPSKVKEAKQHLEMLKSKIENANPDRILRLGFSITRVNGKAVRNPSQLNEGDEIETTFENGQVKSIITWKQEEK